MNRAGRAFAAAGLANALLAAPAAAQTGRYHVMVGATINSLDPFDKDVGTDTGPGLLVRGVPKQGFGPVFDLASYELELRRNPDPRRLGKVELRAGLLGIGYTREIGRLAATLHAAPGYSFNKVETDPSLVSRDRAQFSVKNRLLVRGGLTLTWSAGSRIALVSSVGALLIDPKLALTFRDEAQRELRTESGTWRTNGLVWEVGVAYKVF
jgi:hypothetical protein